MRTPRADGRTGETARPLYRISVVAEMLAIHPQTLRLYERKGLVRPSRTVGRTRLYSPEDVDDLRRILRLSRDLGVNLAGVEIILKMRRQLVTLQQELEAVARHARRDPGAPESGGGSPGGPGLVRVAERQLRRLDIL